jgi:predicted RNase H-like HicB family nuclease
MVTTTEVQTLEFRIVRQVKTDPPLTFTVEMRYSPEDKGYIADCYEMDAFAWGETPEEAIENLLDAMLAMAEAIEAVHAKQPQLQNPRLFHARFVAALGDETKLRKVLGL